MNNGRESLLKISNLSVSYQGRKLLDNISLELSPGQCLGVLGESGAGKSLLASSILDLLPSYLIREGELHWLGRPMQAQVSALRGREISYIPQSPLEASFPAYTIGQQWQHLCRANNLGYNRQLASGLLEQAGINQPDQVLRSFPHQLSGGQLQRALIAMAVTARPKLILADEPTTALDTVNQAQILRLIANFCKRESTALIFITHDIAVVGQLCDTVIVLKDGQVKDSGPIDAVTNTPASDYSRLLVQAHLRLLNRPVATIAPAPSEPILETRNVDIVHSRPGLLLKRGKRTQAVRSVSLQIPRGFITGLAGSSGSGKTTLLRALAGLFPHANHGVFFKGRNLAQLDDNEWRAFRRSVQVIYQHPGESLDPRQAAGETLAEALGVKGETKMTANDLLDWVKLPKTILNLYPSQLSGGEKQRLCIARALALEPEVLLCDEPTSSLDQSIQAEILDLFLYLKKELNLGVLLVSHNLAAIRHTCDFVYVMAEGQIKEEGPVDKVLANPASNFTQQLIKAEPALTHNFL